MADGGKGDSPRPTDTKRFSKNFDAVDFDAEKEYKPVVIKDKLGRKTYRFTPKDRD